MQNAVVVVLHFPQPLDLLAQFSVPAALDLEDLLELLAGGHPEPLEEVAVGVERGDWGESPRPFSLRPNIGNLPLHRPRVDAKFFWKS